MSTAPSSESSRRESVTPLKKDPVQEFVEVIDAHDSFLVVAHSSPDGDAIGSTLAMGRILEQCGKDVEMFNQDSVPYNLSFLSGVERIQSSLEDPGRFDVTVVLDCAEEGRVGETFPTEAFGTTTVVVDHHDTFEDGFADLWVRRPDAAATGEIVYSIANRAGVDLSEPLARSIYCTLVTDTGGFRYSNTSKRTFQIAGEMLEAGVEPWKMTSKLYESQPKIRMDLLSEVLGTLEISPCGRLAFLRIEDEMMSDGSSEGTSELTDGFINYGRAIRGVEVATQMREIDGETWKISFRSKGDVDVSALATRFGGGGHRNAAGCKIEGEPAEIKTKLSEALVDILDG
jgi:phosphoesterase RecJ-like protein